MLVSCVLAFCARFSMCVVCISPKRPREDTGGAAQDFRTGSRGNIASAEKTTANPLQTAASDRWISVTTELLHETIHRFRLPRNQTRGGLGAWRARGCARCASWCGEQMVRRLVYLRLRWLAAGMRRSPDIRHPREMMTRRDETRRDETRRDETRRDETRRDEMRRDETRRDETRRGEMRRDETRRDDAR